MHEQQSRRRLQHSGESDLPSGFLTTSVSAVVVATAKRITNRTTIRLIGYTTLLLVIVSVIAVTTGVLVNSSKSGDGVNVNVTIVNNPNDNVNLPPSSPVVSASSLWNFEHRGSPIETSSEYFGQSIALSSDGSIISMTSNFFHETLVYKYAMEGNDWVQLGATLRHRIKPLNGEPFVNSRICTSLNANGTIVAMGGNMIEDGVSPGMVQVFQYNADAGAANDGDPWLPMGQNLTGNEVDGSDNYAHAVQLSSDGTILAVSSRTGGPTRAGEVHMYKYNTSSNSWISFGKITTGEFVDYENFGYAISISDDGYRIAIGSSNLNSGNSQVQVFEFHADVERVDDADGGIWLQVGQHLTGFKHSIDFIPGFVGAGITFLGDYHLHSTPIALSGDGQSLAVGASLSCDVDDIDTGCFRSYQLVVDTSFEGDLQHVWIKVGNDIYGDNSLDKFGHAVAISRDGQRVGIGAVGVPGYARLFALEELGSDENEKQWVPWTDEKDEIRGSGYDDFGKAVSISSDGSVFAVSAPRRPNSVRNFGGVVEVYEAVPK